MKHAIVTAAITPLGELFCRELLKMGYSLMMVDSCEAELEHLSRQLRPQEDDEVEVLIYPLDLTQRNSTYELFTFCMECEIDVAVVVNSVRDGEYNDLYSYSVETLTTHYSNLMALNESGRIINVVSTSKYGVNIIGRSIFYHYNYQSHNVTVAAVMVSSNRYGVIVQKSLAGEGIITIGLWAKVYMWLLYRLPLYIDYRYKILKKVTRR